MKMSGLEGLDSVKQPSEAGVGQNVILLAQVIRFKHFESKTAHAGSQATRATKDLEQCKLSSCPALRFSVRHHGMKRAPELLLESVDLTAKRPSSFLPQESDFLWEC